ncbi:hypothetical protein QUB70_04260 [Microcoleus sp. A003_D6]
MHSCHIEEESSATDSVTDVTDVTDVADFSSREEGIRKKERVSNSFPPSPFS